MIIELMGYNIQFLNLGDLISFIFSAGTDVAFVIFIFNHLFDALLGGYKHR